MGVVIKSSFKRVTGKGRSVFRINIDNNEMLSNLEQGNTHMAIDICTDKFGNPSVYRGTGKRGKFQALHYYYWAMKPRGEKNENNEIKQNAWTTSS